jgi:hypothetical protein
VDQPCEDERLRKLISLGEGTQTMAAWKNFRNASSFVACHYSVDRSRQNFHDSDKTE